MKKLIVFIAALAMVSVVGSPVHADLSNLDVPTYDQYEFGHGCTMDCSPTAGAMVLGYYDSNGWPRMVPRGSADYSENPDGVRQLVMDLWDTMDYTCHEGTSPLNVGPGIIETASNMDPGAQFVLHSFLEITNDNKETAFEILKGYINNGWPVVFSSYAGLKYYYPNNGTYGVLTDGHSMAMTGYRDDPAGRMIFLNSGWAYPRDKMWVDYDDLGVDLDKTDPKQIWIACVVPGGTPSLDIWGACHFRSLEGPNSIGWTEGDRLLLSCNVDPVVGTTVVATNPDTGYSLTLSYLGGYAPYEFGGSVAYDPAKTGNWVITATNGPHTAEATTPEIGDVEQIPFLRNVQLIGSGLTPTISWTVPPGTGADRANISVMDGNTGIRLWRGPNLGLEITAYTIPESVLQANYPYVIRARLEDTFGDDISGLDRSRSDSFFNFTPLEEGEPDAVFLPTVGQDPDSADEFGAAFMFDIDVAEGVPCFIDPFVAIGYDYAIGAEDSIRFGAVTLPEVGDNLFDLYLWDGSQFYLEKKDLLAGETFFFNLGGVDRFRILGIEAEAELDPLDVTAFITELTFTGTGRFTGTMTPVIKCPATVDIDPGTLNLKSTGKWITCYIELPEGYAVEDINVATVRLEGTIPAETSPTEVGDSDEDGLPDLMMKFDRQALIEYVDGTIGEVMLTVTGEVDGTLFEGSDKIAVLD